MILFIGKSEIKKPFKLKYLKGFIFSVGRTGFEPATPWSQTTYSTGLNYLPKNPSVETNCRMIKNIHHCSLTALPYSEGSKASADDSGEGGIRTLGTSLSSYNGLANRPFRPLRHLSVSDGTAKLRGNFQIKINNIGNILWF
jgi:hypothetical protein